MTRILALLIAGALMLGGVLPVNAHPGSLQSRAGMCRAFTQHPTHAKSPQGVPFTADVCILPSWETEP